MLGFIKNLFAGIFSFIVGLLSGKKKSGNGYFLELSTDETSEIKSVASNDAQNATKVGKPESAPKSDVVEVAKKTAKVQPAKPALPVETSFASKYLLSSGSSNGRRLPGANMNIYLEMAREIKTV
jgi:hypothetical protein